MIDYNIYVENEYSHWNIDTEKITKTVEEIFKYYMTCPEIYENCCLKDYEYDTVAFDFLFCTLTLKLNTIYCACTTKTKK